MTNHTITAYTDGASKGNPGPGGWGVVLRCETTGAAKHIAGAIPQATNNAAELLAAIHALISLRTRCKITIHNVSIQINDHHMLRL